MSIVNGSIQIANYTQAEWQAWNGVLKSGQIAISTDQFYGTTNAPKYKVGNGVDTWANLDYHPDTTGGANTASNGLNVVGSDVQLGGALTKDTTVAGGAFDFQLSGIPKANHTTILESSQDLFGLQALVGQSINGQGMKYNLTYDGNGDPESWVFVKVSDDANLGFGYNATMGYINLATGEETYFEATPAAVNMLVNNGGLPAGISIDRATEKVSVGMNGSERLTIDFNETKLPPFAGGGSQMVTVDNAGVLGVQAIPASSTGKLINIYSDTVITSAVGNGYAFSTVHNNGFLVIPANTLQAGDIIVAKGGTYRAGTGTAAQLMSFARQSTMPNSPVLGTDYISCNSVQFGAYAGFEFSLYLGAAGAFYMPNSGTATNAGINNTQITGTQIGATPSTGWRQDSVVGLDSPGVIDYTQPLYLVNWGIAANTSTMYQKFLQIEHYRP